MSFVNERVVVSLPKAGWPLTVLFPVTYIWTAGPDKRVVSVPEGFVTDLASTPRIFWRIFPPFGRYALAAIVHDWLYLKQPEGFTRKLADQCFLDAMRDLRVGWLTRHVMHKAVRLGGGAAWSTS